MSQGWLKVNLTVAEAESLLKTEYKVYAHSDSGVERLACDEYSVPHHLREHIDFITPTVHMDATVKVKPKKRSLDKRTLEPVSDIKPGAIIETFDNVHNVSPQPQVTYSLANCNTYVTPDCLRALYQFSNGTLSGSSYGIVEYTPQVGVVYSFLMSCMLTVKAYLQSDLNIFYTNLARQIPNGTAPTIDLIDGAVVQNTTQSFDDNGESDLDLQYAIALGM